MKAYVMLSECMFGHLTVMHGTTLLIAESAEEAKKQYIKLLEEGYPEADIDCKAREVPREMAEKIARAYGFID